MTFIDPTAIVYPNVVLGDDVIIGPFCVIGGEPEHKSFYGKRTSFGVRIAGGARIFSHVTIDAGTCRDTIVGARTAIFQKSHVAHDCAIGDDVTVGGMVSLAGHTTIMDGATISGMSCSFQRVVIGAYAFIAGMSYMTKDIPPAEKWGGGQRAVPLGINEVGLDRAHMTYQECLAKYGGEYDRLIGSKA